MQEEVIGLKNIIQLDSYPVQTTLRILLQDKTTKKNIIWATDSYASFGEAYTDKSQITEDQLKKMNYGMIPAWLCNKMNNFCDEEWFGYKDVFNRQAEHEWIPIEDNIRFPAGKEWKEYIDSKRLEITCGEAPYLVSRYDASTGEMIDIPKRIGLLDRKIRVVNENTTDEFEWMKWVVRAFQSVYGYEYQGDNLYPYTL